MEAKQQYERLLETITNEAATYSKRSLDWIASQKRLKLASLLYDSGYKPVCDPEFACSVVEYGGNECHCDIMSDGVMRFGALIANYDEEKMNSESWGVINEFLDSYYYTMSMISLRFKGGNVVILSDQYLGEKVFDISDVAYMLQNLEEAISRFRRMVDSDSTLKKYVVCR